MRKQTLIVYPSIFPVLSGFSRDFLSDRCSFCREVILKSSWSGTIWEKRGFSASFIEFIFLSALRNNIQDVKCLKWFIYMQCHNYFERIAWIWWHLIQLHTNMFYKVGLRSFQNISALYCTNRQQFIKMMLWYYLTLRRIFANLQTSVLDKISALNYESYYRQL